MAHCIAHNDHRVTNTPDCQDVEVFVGDVIAVGELGVAFELVEGPRDPDARAHDMQLVQAKIGVTLESVGALHPEVPAAWQSLQGQPESTVQGAVRRFVRNGRWQVALYVLCCALQQWPTSATCMAQVWKAACRK